MYSFSLSSLRHTVKHGGREERRVGDGDDKNVMPFTTLLSAQIAE